MREFSQQINHNIVERYGWCMYPTQLTRNSLSINQKFECLTKAINDFIDAFLRSRDQSDHESTAMVKAQFMSLWDGLCTDSTCKVLIMGATNRPMDVDPAFRRRMPCMLQISLPVCLFILLQF